jgi:hypothetical protein
VLNEEEMNRLLVNQDALLPKNMKKLKRLVYSEPIKGENIVTKGKKDECSKNNDCSCMNHVDSLFVSPQVGEIQILQGNSNIGKLEFNRNVPEAETAFKRAIRADEVFSILWDIDQECRGCLKYNVENASDVLEKIRDMINETDLMDLYV